MHFELSVSTASVADPCVGPKTRPRLLTLKSSKVRLTFQRSPIDSCFWMGKAARGLNPTPQSLGVHPSLFGALFTLLAVLAAMKAFARWRDLGLAFHVACTPAYKRTAGQAVADGLASRRSFKQTLNEGPTDLNYVSFKLSCGGWCRIAALCWLLM